MFSSEEGGTFTNHVTRRGHVFIATTRFHQQFGYMSSTASRIYSVYVRDTLRESWEYRTRYFQGIETPIVPPAYRQSLLLPFRHLRSTLIVHSIKLGGFLGGNPLRVKHSGGGGGGAAKPGTNAHVAYLRSKICPLQFKSPEKRPCGDPRHGFRKCPVFTVFIPLAFS